MSTPMLPTHSLIWRHDQAQTFSHVQRCAKLPTHSMKFELEVSGHLSLNMAYGCLWQIEQPRRKCGHSYRRAMAMGRSKLRWIRKCRPVGLRKLCTVSWAPGPRSIEVQKMMISLCSPGWIESDLVEIDGKQKNLEDQTVSCFSFDFSFPSVSPTVVLPLPLMIHEAPPETSNSGETALFKALSKISKHWAA